LTTSAEFPDGPPSVARIAYFCPYGVGASAVASWDRCWLQRAASSWRQFSDEYPSARKKAALNRPIGWLRESRYAWSFAGSITARSAFGIRNRQSPSLNLPRSSGFLVRITLRFRRGGRSPAGRTQYLPARPPSPARS